MISKLTVTGLLLGASALGLAAFDLPAAAQAAVQTGSRATLGGDDQPVLVEADSIIEREEDGLVIAEGNVEARFEGRFLRADRVVYNVTTQIVRATGNVEILDPDGSIRYAEDIEVDGSLDGGVATGFATRLPNDSYAVASTAERLPDGRNRLNQVIYTACRVCAASEANGGTPPPPTWALRARQATLNPNTQMISYSDAVLEIAGVPVLYLPYFTHPDPNSERRSGLMVPDAGVTSDYGAFAEVPYLWVLSESAELEVRPRVMQRINPLLMADYRQRLYSGSFKAIGAVTNEQLFDRDGEKFGDRTWRSAIAASGQFDINADTIWGFATERLSDDTFDRRYRFRVEGEARGLFASQSQRLLSQLFLVNQGPDHYASSSLISVQNVGTLINDRTQPAVLPLVTANRRFDVGRWGGVTVGGQAAMLDREVGDDVTKLHAHVDWQNRHILPGGLVFSPFVGARADYYEFRPEGGVDRTVDRALWQAGAEISWPLARTGGGVDLLIEPLLTLATGTDDPNDPAIAVQDSRTFQLSEQTLLRGQAVDSYDLVEGGTRAGYGVRAQARVGDARVSGFVGQRWRDEADPRFTRISNLDGTRSDVVGRLDFSLGALSVLNNFRLDADSGELLSGSTRFGLSGSWGSVTASYFTVEPELNVAQSEAASIGARINLTPRWALLAAQTRDLGRETTPFQRIGVEYSDDCTTLQLVAERRQIDFTSTRTSTDIAIRFTLRTLGGSIGEDLDF
jgi:LPS-assembly protein